MLFWISYECAPAPRCQGEIYFATFTPRVIRSISQYFSTRRLLCRVSRLVFPRLFEGLLVYICWIDLASRATVDKIRRRGGCHIIGFTKDFDVRLLSPKKDPPIAAHHVSRSDDFCSSERTQRSHNIPTVSNYAFTSAVLLLNQMHLACWGLWNPSTAFFSKLTCFCTKDQITNRTAVNVVYYWCQEFGALVRSVCLKVY